MSAPNPVGPADATQQQKIEVDPGRVIGVLRQQVAELSFAVAVQTARAEQAEAALAEARA